MFLLTLKLNEAIFNYFLSITTKRSFATATEMQSVRLELAQNSKDSFSVRIFIISIVSIIALLIVNWISFRSYNGLLNVSFGNIVVIEIYLLKLP